MSKKMSNFENLKNIIKLSKITLSMLTKFLFLSIIYKISKLDIYKCPNKCPKFYLKKKRIKNIGEKIYIFNIYCNYALNNALLSI